jgi:D-alanyl-D-alanine carboxypeptidase
VKIFSKSVCIAMLVSTYMTTLSANPLLDQNNMARTVLSNLIEENKTPGLQYIFIAQDHTIFQFTGGYAEIASKQVVTDQTTFNVYSVTKTFTAAAVLKLSQQHMIDLDAPLSQYLPELPYKPSPTIRQTLQHTAGFPNPNPLSWIHLADHQDTFDDDAFIKQVIQDNPKLDFEPGSKFAYSNVGYLVLGQLITRVSGRSYEDYVVKEIIAPLGLTGQQKITFRIDHPDTHAYGYIRRWYWLNLALGLFFDRGIYMDGNVNGWSRFNHMQVNGKAYGGLSGNAAGFARYLQAILRREAPFSQQLLDSMWQPAHTNDGKPLRVTLSWFRGDFNGERYYSHSGGAGGYYCEMRVYPDANRASMILTNNTGISTQNYLNKIDGIFIQ